MTVCPNCNHENPEGAAQCEACYTVLPLTITCPNCGANVQSDATFCGQCGFHLNVPGASLPEQKNVAGSLLETQLNFPQPQPETPTPSSTSEEKEEATEIVGLPTSAGLSLTLEHVQTRTLFEIPKNTSVTYIGRPNDQATPDIDVSAFPDADIVSRTHADIRQEGEAFYLQDLGSANGTYVNGKRLSGGIRQELKTGDRIALGKQDKVSFIVTINNS